MGKIYDALERAIKPASNKKKLADESPILRSCKTSNGVIVPLNAHRQASAEKMMHSDLVAFHHPQSVEAEQFKVLKTNLFFTARSKTPKIIMVTSAVAGEGKSFVSCNLAVSIAQDDEEQVMLIDCNLRTPSVNRFFGFGSATGWCRYLMKEFDISRYYIKNPVPKLTVLPAGTPPPNAAELLTAKKIKSLLSEAMQRCENGYIIIDSATPSLASETISIASYVDGIIIVVKAGRTHRKDVTAVIDQLGREKIVGIVMNNSD